MPLQMSAVELAALITENVAVLSGQPEKHNSTNNTDTSGLSSIMVSEAKSKALQAIHDLELLIRGPLETIMTQAQYGPVPLHIIHEFQVAKAVPLEDGSRTTYQDIAASTGLSQRHLRRVIRSVMLNRIFDEPEAGYVVHTPASRLLAEDTQVQCWVDFHLNHILPSKLKVVKAMRTYPECTKSSQSGFAFAHEDQDFYSFLKSDPVSAKKFHAGINAGHRQGGAETSHLIKNIPEDLLKTNFKWIDVGGGDGSTMRDLALAHQGIQCVVQDLPHVVKNHVVLPAGIEDRVNFMAYDFFAEQPIVGADVYLLRNVLLNWHDHDSIRIIRRIVEAMEPSSKVIISDMILPDREQVPYTMERKLRNFDLDMFTIFNNSERDRQEWLDLLSTSSLGLEVENIITPKFSNHSLIILSLKSV